MDMHRKVLEEFTKYPYLAVYVTIIRGRQPDGWNFSALRRSSKIIPAICLILKQLVKLLNDKDRIFGYVDEELPVRITVV
jgi:hypothetical protein